MRRASATSVLASLTAALLAACGEPLPPIPRRSDPPAPLQEPTPDKVAAMPGADERGHVAVVAPVEAVDVAPAFNGKLIAVHVRPGDRVTAGQVLAELDPRTVREALAMAKASSRAARAAVRQAKVEVDDARREVSSETKAVKNGVSPVRTLELATARYERAKAAHEAAKAARDEADARLEQATSGVSDTAVRAPFAGTVAMRLRDRGADTGPGAPVVRLIGEGGLRIRFAVSPEDAIHFAPGTVVVVDVEGARAPMRATVRQVSPELDGPTRLIFIEAELEAADAVLRTGLPARVRLPR
jgi:RND family efflux transporter MFP subunit